MQTAIVPVSLPKQAVLSEANVRTGARNPDCCVSRKGEPLAMPVCIAGL